MLDQRLQNFTFLQCVIIFWHLTKLGDQHNSWLRANGQNERFLCPQEPAAEDYKGWFFWMFLNKFNIREIKDCFRSQGWSTKSDERWFGKKLAAWGWNRPTREEPNLLEHFIGFITEFVPATELGLKSDDPKVSDYIKVPGWATSPKVNQYQDVTFRDLENQSFALLDYKPALSSRDTLEFNSSVNRFVRSPSAVSQQSLKRVRKTSPQPMRFTNVPTPHPTTLNGLSNPPQFKNRELPSKEFSMSISHGELAFMANRDTDYQPHSFSHSFGETLPAGRYEPPVTARDNPNSPKLLSMPSNGPGKPVQSSRAGNYSQSSGYQHAADQQNALGLPEPISPLSQTNFGQKKLPSMTACQLRKSGALIKHKSWIDNPPFRSRLRGRTNLPNQQTVLGNHPAFEPKDSVIMEIGPNKRQAPRYSLSNPQEQLRPGLDHSPMINLSTKTRESKLLKQSEPKESQVEITHQPASITKRRKVAVHSSIGTSPTGCSIPEQVPAQTNIAWNSPLRISPKISRSHSNGAVSGKKHSSFNADGDMEIFKPPDRQPVTSPGAMAQTVNENSSQKSVSALETRAASRHVETSRDTPPSRAFTHSDEAMVESGYWKVKEPRNTLLEASKTISDSGSDTSSREVMVDMWDEILCCAGGDVDADNDIICKLFGHLGG